MKHFPARFSSARSFMLIALAGSVIPTLAAAQVSTFTGASANNPVNWCDGDNWFPSGVPADGSIINVPEGQLVNMFECPSVPTRILGTVNAGGTIRFWIPVVFAGGGSLTNPIFDFSTTPVPVASSLFIAGPNAQWHGANFSGGNLHNAGTLIVQRTSFGGRQFPRALIDGCVLTNAGTMRVLDSFNIEGTSVLMNNGNLNCETTSTIGRDSGSAALQNAGNINVAAGQGLTVTSGFVSNGMITSAGSLTLRSETTLLGSARVESGGTIRFFAPLSQPVTLGPVLFTGDGNVQLTAGLLRILDITTGVRGSNGARGLWFASTDPIDVTLGRVYIAEEGLLTWSAGRIVGGNGARQNPHIDIASGGVFSAVGAPGFAGGGDALGTFFRVEGSMLQYSTARLLEGSRVVVLPGGRYSLSHTRLDGDGTCSLEVNGRLDINHPEDARTATTFLNGVPTRLLGSSVMTVYANDLITSSSPIELGGSSSVVIDSTTFRSSRWRAFGETIVTDGTPSITGDGTFEIASGATLTVRTATLTVDMENDGEAAFGAFDQIGTLRADPGASGSGARVQNNGLWTWRGGGLTFPQGSEPAVRNTGVFVADCGSCQLRTDFLNTGQATIIDTLVMAEPGVEFVNALYTEVRGNITDPTGAHEGRLINRLGGLISKRGTSFSSISTTLDNQGQLQVAEGTLSLNSPIVQLTDGALTGGAWVVEAGATLTTPGQVIHTVGLGAVVVRNGSWNSLQLRNNFGSLSIRGGTQTLGGDFVNYGELDVHSAAGVVTPPFGSYSQRTGRTIIQPGGNLSSGQPVTVEGGTLGGSGTVATPWLLNPSGVIQPGQSPGVLTVNGGFDQAGPDGSLVIELAGVTPGSQHDVLAVTGAAVLGGTLRVHLLDGFVPAPGDSFTILTATSISGAFTSIESPELADASLRMRTQIGQTEVTIRFACAADFNADGATDPDDLADYISAFFISPPDPAADFNLDAAVDPDDLADYINAFFAGCD